MVDNLSESTAPVVAESSARDEETPVALEDADVKMAVDETGDPAAVDQVDDMDNALPEQREPLKKDIALQEFMSKMDDYAPIIPDAVTAHHLLLAGLDPNTTPLPLQRLLALATQKFIADIAADAYQYSRMRTSNAASATNPLAANPLAAGDASAGTSAGQAGRGKEGEKSGRGAQGHILGVQRAGYGGGAGGGGAAQGRAVLTMEDLGCAVGEYGVNVKRGEFYR